MDAADCPIMKPGNPKRATAATPRAENFPGIGQIVAIFPNNFSHVAKVLWSRLSEAERNCGFEPGLPISPNLVGRHSTIYSAEVDGTENVSIATALAGSAAISDAATVSESPACLGQI